MPSRAGLVLPEARKRLLSGLTGLYGGASGPAGDGLYGDDKGVYYHRWRVGDVLTWDGRATMHRGAGDSRPDRPRIMLRTIVDSN